jgi:ABC-type amino acid transport substrate-binding protein
MFAMSKQITKAFRVESEAWANFVKAAESYGATPAELLRELVAHVDAAMKGIQSGEIKGFDGDVARLIKSEFPQLSPFQLKTMARILMQVSEMDEDSTSKEQPIN